MGNSSELIIINPPIDGRLRLGALLAMLLLAVPLLGGCSFYLTNQTPPPGGCVGEPARVFC